MFAIVETGGKQYKVAEGDLLKVEKLPKPEKDSQEIIFDKVLLIVDDKGQVKLGNPYLPKTTLTAKFVAEGRDKKITVIKYKPKVRYRVKRGHRQSFTKIQVAKIA